MLGAALMLGLGGELEFPWWCVRTTFELLAVVCKKGHTGCSRNDSQSFRVACYFLFFLLWWRYLFFSSYLKGDNKAGTRRAAPATPATSNSDSPADLCAAVCHCKRKPHVSLVTAKASCEHRRGDGTV